MVTAIARENERTMPICRIARTLADDLAIGGINPATACHPKAAAAGHHVDQVQHLGGFPGNRAYESGNVGGRLSLSTGKRDLTLVRSTVADSPSVTSTSRGAIAAALV